MNTTMTLELTDEKLAALEYIRKMQQQIKEFEENMPALIVPFSNKTVKRMKELSEQLEECWRNAVVNDFNVMLQAHELFANMQIGKTCASNRYYVYNDDEYEI